MRPRDRQRSRVYSAEFSCSFWKSEPFEDLPQVTKYVKSVYKNKFIKKYWGNIEPPQVRDGRGRRSASGSRWVLKFPRSMRHKLIILHEIAHALTPRVYEAHGEEFTSNYLSLVREFMGKECSDALEQAFDVKNVRYERLAIYNRDGEQTVKIRKRRQETPASSEVILPTISLGLLPESDIRGGDVGSVNIEG